MDEENDYSQDSKQVANAGKAAGKAALTTAKLLIKKIGMKYIIIVVAVILVIVLLAACLRMIKLDMVDNSSDTESDNYREYGPEAYMQEVITNGVTAGKQFIDNMWKNDTRYSQYISTQAELEYFLNAQLVNQYPYIASGGDDVFSGTVKFYRNDSTECMQYVSQEQFQNYIDSYNSKDSSADVKTKALKNVLNSFAINEDGTIKIAYTTEDTYTVVTDDSDAATDAKSKISGSTESTDKNGKITIQASTKKLSTTNISYRNYLQSYALPFNFLWTILVMGYSEENTEDFVHELANMAYSGEISLIIDDSTLITTTTDKYTYNKTKHYNGEITSTIKIEKYPDWEKFAELEEQGKKLEDYKVNTFMTETHTETKKVEGCVINEPEGQLEAKTFQTIYKENHTYNSPSLKIKKIESWCAILENSTEFSVNSTSNSENPSITDLEDSELIDDGNITFEEAVNIPIYELLFWKNQIDASYGKLDGKEIIVDEQVVGNNKVSISYTGTLSVKRNNTNIKLETVNTSDTRIYAGNVTSPSFNEAILTIFAKKEYKGITEYICDTSESSWFMDALEVNADTANILDLIKYILNKASGESTSDEDFSSIWSDIYKGYNSIYGGVSGLDGNIGIIFDYFLAKGISPQGCAGIIGNLMQESYESCIPTTLEYPASHAEGISYTQSVNNGTYTESQFVNDKQGYGLAQWTYYTRKQDLYNFAKSYGTEFDIGNINMQLDFLWKELTSDYTSAYNAVKDATDPVIAAKMFQDKFENPNQQKAEEEKRKQCAQDVYNKYLASSTTSIVQQAIEVHKYVRENNYQYNDQITKYVPNHSTNLIDCSSFVTWVLVNSGVEGFKPNMGQWTSADFNSNPYNWKEVSINEAKSGDIICYLGHVEIVAKPIGAIETKFRVYNCGGDTSIMAKGTTELPESSTSGYTINQILKILRVTDN